MSSTMTPLKGIIINDPVHDSITLSSIARIILDHRHMQRLRNLKQLGVTHLVYPTADHSRFEHAIGTYHVSLLITRHLLSNKPDLMTKDEAECISIAALCHDVGRSPYCHVLEEFISQKNSKWSFKEYTLIILSDIFFDILRTPGNHGKFQDAKYFLKNKENRKLIYQLVAGPDYTPSDHLLHVLNHQTDYRHDETEDIHLEMEKHGFNLPNDKYFMYEILMNQRCGIDAHRLEYLKRDGYYLNFGPKIDIQRYICSLKVLQADGKSIICISQRHLFGVLNLMSAAREKVLCAYKHKNTMSFGLLIQNLLMQLLNEEDEILLNYSESLKKLRNWLKKVRNGNVYSTYEEDRRETLKEIKEDVDYFVTLNDAVLMNSFEVFLRHPEKKDSKMNIFYRRLNQHDNFKLIVSYSKRYSISDGEMYKTQKENLLKKIEENNENSNENGQMALSVIYFGCKEKVENPLNSVYFYTKENPDTPCCLKDIPDQHILADQAIVPDNAIIVLLVRFYNTDEVKETEISSTNDGKIVPHAEQIFSDDALQGFKETLE